MADRRRGEFMNLRIRIISPAVKPSDKVWKFQVGHNLTFENLEAILRANFGGLDGQLLFFLARNGLQIGHSCEYQMVASCVRKDDILIVQEGPRLDDQKPSTRTYKGRSWWNRQKASPPSLVSSEEKEFATCCNSATCSVHQEHDDKILPAGVTVDDDFDELFKRQLEIAKQQSMATCGRPYRQQHLSGVAAPTLLSGGLVFEDYKKPSPPQNDNTGQLIAEGSFSQYAIGGRSACTHICMVACNRSLSENAFVSVLNRVSIDEFVTEGVRFYQEMVSTTQHASAEELWHDPSFGQVVHGLEKGSVYQGTVANRMHLITAFERAVDFGAGCGRFAVVLTKSGETVLCVADSADRDYEYMWYLFDSHGQSHASNKLAYWKSFSSFHGLVDAFLRKYPAQDFESDVGVQSYMYNLFEALPIVRRMPSSASNSTILMSEETPSTSMAHKPMTPTKEEDLDSSMDAPAHQPNPTPPPPKAGATCPTREPDPKMDIPEQMTKGDPKKLPTASKNTADLQTESDAYSPDIPVNHPDLQATRSSGVSGSPGSTPQSEAIMRGLFSVEEFQCSISREIMADPVVCSDGHLYDRPNIEHFFEVREEEEANRIATLEAQGEGDTEQENDGTSASCCGAAQAPIELISPMTGEVVDGTVTPVHLTEQQIVRAIECNAFMLDDNELADWHQRRKEKKQRDRKRDLEQKRAREREEEMRRNAEEAEQIRSAEEAELPDEPSLRIRIDRDTNEDSERLSEDDLGISLVLANKEHRIPATYASQGGSSPRCMVACCAVSLDYNRWCARCARLACDGCLSFGVTSITQHTHSERDVEHICFECASQVADVMNSPDIRIRQKRAVLERQLERRLTVLGNQASTKQDRVIRFDVEEEFSGRMSGTEYTIGRLESQLMQLREQVESQKQKTAEVSSSSGDEDESDSDMRRQLASLEIQYEEILSQPEPSGEDEQFEYMCRMSDLSTKIEAARVKVAVTQSSKLSAVDGKSSKSRTMPLAEKQLELQRLQERLVELSGPVKGESFQDEIARAINKSEVAQEIESLTMELVGDMTSATEHSSTSANSEMVDFPALGSLIADLSAFGRHNARKKGYFWNRRTRSDELMDLTKQLGKQHRMLTESPGKVPSLVQVEKVLVQMDQLKISYPLSIRRGFQAALREVTSYKSASAAPLSPIQANGTGGEDLLAEFVRLTNQDISDLPYDKQFVHIARVSEIDAMLSAAEETLFQTELDTVPVTRLVVDARQDIEAIGARLVSWPLPLGLEYPTPRMERQLEVLRNTMDLRKVESRRTYESHLMDQHEALVSRQEELEDEVAQTQRELQDATENHARLEEARRKERIERRRREEKARQERERALREEAQRARRAAEELRQRHEAEEAATEEAFRNANAEGGAASFGGRGDLRMCRRCRAGPIENIACADLQAHNNNTRDYKGRPVASVNQPNACPRCKWFNPDWRNWPYWDGIYGPH